MRQQIKVYWRKLISDKFRRPFAFDKVNTALKNAWQIRKIKISDIAKSYYTSGKGEQKAIVDYIVGKSGLKGQDADLLSRLPLSKIADIEKAIQ